MNRNTRQTAALFAGNFILWTLVAQVNHTCAPWQIHLWLGGLLIAPGALTAVRRAGAMAAFLTGLALDASTPVPFGTTALVLLAGHTLIYCWRVRLARTESHAQLLAAQVANGGTLLLFALLEAGAGPASSGLWLRLPVELLASGLVLVVVAPWFFALQNRLLSLAGAAPRPEDAAC